MDLDKVYYDSKANKLNILQMVKKEPEWAGNMIQFYEDKLKSLEQETEALHPLMQEGEGEWIMEQKEQIREILRAHFDGCIGSYQQHMYGIELDKAVESLEALMQGGDVKSPHQDCYYYGGSGCGKYLIGGGRNDEL